MAVSTVKVLDFATNEWVPAQIENLSAWSPIVAEKLIAAAKQIEQNGSLSDPRASEVGLHRWTLSVTDETGKRKGYYLALQAFEAPPVAKLELKNIQENPDGSIEGIVKAPADSAFWANGCASPRHRMIPLLRSTTMGQRAIRKLS